MAAADLDGKVNLNQASASQLELLPGIGPATAQKILDYRAKKTFESSIQIMRIKGVGRATYNKLKPYLTVSGPSTLKIVK